MLPTLTLQLLHPQSLTAGGELSHQKSHFRVTEQDPTRAESSKAIPAQAGHLSCSWGKQGQLLDTVSPSPLRGSQRLEKTSTIIESKL